MRISDWSSDVCSSDLQRHAVFVDIHAIVRFAEIGLIVRFKLPFGQSQFRIELPDRAPGHRALHLLRKGEGRRAGALHSAHTVGILPAPPDAGGDAAGKAQERAPLYAPCPAGLSTTPPTH